MEPDSRMNEPSSWAGAGLAILGGALVLLGFSAEAIEAITSGAQQLIAIGAGAIALVTGIVAVVKRELGRRRVP